MSGSNIYRQWLFSLWVIFLLGGLLFGVTACGGDGSSAVASRLNDTGELVFSINWHTAAPDARSTKAIADCAGEGVAWVQCSVYDAADALLVEGPDWRCEEHGGSIENIPAGSDRMLVCLGLDSDDNILHLAHKGGITVQADQVTDAGDIDSQPFVISLRTPEDGSTDLPVNRFNLSWAEFSGVREYQVEVDEDVAFADPLINATVTENFFHPENLEEDTLYYWRVTPTDRFGNVGRASDPRQFATASGGVVCEPTAEVCNNIDDDCDGVVDNDVPAEPITCGVGECAGNTGERRCESGRWVDDCDPTQGAVDEICDGLDNDCDGVADENMPTEPTTCGVGECVGNTGERRCEDGEWIDTCEPAQGAYDEICDGLDNDCDGDTDEGIYAIHPSPYEDITLRYYGTLSSIDQEGADASNIQDQIGDRVWGIVRYRFNETYDGETSALLSTFEVNLSRTLINIDYLIWDPWSPQFNYGNAEIRNSEYYYFDDAYVDFTPMPTISYQGFEYLYINPDNMDAIYVYLYVPWSGDFPVWGFGFEINVDHACQTY